MSEPKTIYCPKCGKKVGPYDGRSSSNLVTRCKDCRKQIVYYVETGDIKVKPLPQRQVSGGVTY